MKLEEKICPLCGKPINKEEFAIGPDTDDNFYHGMCLFKNILMIKES